MARIFGGNDGHHQMIITAKTVEVLEALKRNREKHIKEYEEAKVAFFVAAEKKVNQALGRVREKRFESLAVHLSVPTSYEKVYDTAIRMLELHRNSGAETIELDSTQVDSLVHDIWDWTQSFRATNSSYALEDVGAVY